MSNLKSYVIPSFIIACAFLAVPAQCVTIGGPITANDVSVTGSVTMSSMTVSSTTVLHALRVNGSVEGLPGNISPAKSSTTLLSFQTTSTTYMAVPISNSITLSKAGDYIRISLSGLLFVNDSTVGSAYLTIKRDSVDIGNTINNSGLAIASSNETLGDYPVIVPVGISIIDKPGDTNTHIYQPFIRTSTTSVNARFTSTSIGQLLLEEISQ